MKLVTLVILTIGLAVNVESNDHFTFPPKFHPHNNGRIMVSSDSAVYLPPESHTTISYFPINNMNNLPYPYLPHTGNKAPVILPTPYPIMLSSTLLPLDQENDDNDDDQSLQVQRNNRTERNLSQKIEKRDLRPRPENNQPIDRIDVKIPYGFQGNNVPTYSNPQIQKATPRSLIISAEHQRNDAMDQLRAAAAFQGPQYLPAPNTPGVYISSTTETAIPILRLSNEMDLDGSFSYEALGADQTHYVQHSRMENTGTDKEEQVVEGSYSYVGDNGQTYTVHYIADSKGFRASGDHLPVPPPVPEIIQRAIQFNLAEEAKKPPNERGWNEEKENELSESSKFHRYSIPPQARPLFTGKTPESFSFGFAQGSHNTQNNLVASASSQNPIKTNIDFSQEQIKNNINGGTISPQITFLASQGAHVPSVNPQPTISRVFTTERPILPQLMNYEAAVKESEQESNKALWRWQYGLNANINNQSPDKNTISRSFGEGDDIMINFGDMSPDQYSKMLKSQFESNTELPHNDQVAQTINIKNVYYPQSDPVTEMIVPRTSTETNYETTPKQENYNTRDEYFPSSISNNEVFKSRKHSDSAMDSRLKLITQNDFVPPNQLVTQSYDYEFNSYEPRRIIKSSTSMPSIYTNIHHNHNYEKATQNVLWTNMDQIENVQKLSTTESPIISTTRHDIIKFDDFITNNSNDFKPLHRSQADTKHNQASTTTEEIDENALKENIFLKNLFKNKKNEPFQVNKIREENKNIFVTKINTDRKPEKYPKFMQLQAKPQNDIKGTIKKPLEIADILNYLTSKNHFESAKVNPKAKYGSNNYNQRSEIRFIPVQHEDNNDDDEESIGHESSHHRTSYYHPEELQGIIKNYKVLQRNNSALNNGQDDHLRRNLAPPPIKMIQPNLPPLGRAGPSMKSYLPPLYI